MSKKRPRSRTLAELSDAYLEHLEVSHYSAGRIKLRRTHLADLVEWLALAGITDAREVTPNLVAAYRQGLAERFPSKPYAQKHRLSALRCLFRWLHRTGEIPLNPTTDLEPMRSPDALPKAILTVEEVERTLRQPDLSSPQGLRDRAILETLYATAIRPRELLRLCCGDLDAASATLMIREGKGGRDRVVPLGERALFWTLRFVDEARDSLLIDVADETLFPIPEWPTVPDKRLGVLVRGYLDQAGIDKPGRCYLFRHTAATHMLEGGADIRYVQEMLGHTWLTTTQIYTRVAIPQLKLVHSRTHPASSGRTTGEPPRR